MPVLAPRTSVLDPEPDSEHGILNFL
ncbi:MAG: hypothetical protein RLZ44_750, partial [Pseudomonadota bacterium]